MRSTKLKRKLLAGILCAAMVFQSIPMEQARWKLLEGQVMRRAQTHLKMQRLQTL